ncbi:hypothetical protein FPV67DRAFT_1453281 [Lyophyllum atratum]|nr:hypothetical protein FPV67DRAFT_1453281 [Lyophyllum atratum]
MSWDETREEERRQAEAIAKLGRPLHADGGEWFTVSRRRPRARSLGENQLSESQADTVRRAEGNLTSAQNDLLRKREQATRTHARANERPASRGEGPSKGKNIDPTNWGAAGIPAEELDSAAQQAALDEYASRAPTPVVLAPVNESVTSAVVETELRNELESLRAELKMLRKQNSRKQGREAKNKDHVPNEKDMRPSTQIAAKSFLGKAFKNVEAKKLTVSRDYANAGQIPSIAALG